MGNTWGDQPNTTKQETTDTRHNTMATTKGWEGGWAKNASSDSKGRTVNRQLPYHCGQTNVWLPGFSISHFGPDPPGRDITFQNGKSTWYTEYAKWDRDCHMFLHGLQATCKCMCTGECKPTRKFKFQKAKGCPT